MKSPQQILLTLVRRWRLRDYTPLIEIIIRKNALLENLHAFQGAYPRIEIAPVLKSNAYGHGLFEIASILEGEHCPFLCVDSYYEAMTLRNKGVRSPILIIGYTEPANLKRPPLSNVSFAIIGMAHLRNIEQILLSPTAFHLKLDTGMHRQGIMPKELSETIAIIKKSKNIKIQGAFSHFANADSADEAFTKKQIETWNKCIRIIRSEIPGIRYAHLAATAGSFFSKKIDANVIRLGLGLYGYDRCPERNLNLKPVLEMRAKITSTREIEKGEFVGYGLTFKALKKMNVATIPAGYYEGIDRRLSNKGYVSIKETPCKIIGRVSMNMTSIDVSNIPNIETGAPATIISANPEDKNSIKNMARLAKTTPYVILVHLPSHLRRIVLSESAKSHPVEE